MLRVYHRQPSGFGTESCHQAHYLPIAQTEGMGRSGLGHPSHGLPN